MSRAALEDAVAAFRDQATAAERRAVAADTDWRAALALADQLRAQFADSTGHADRSATEQQRAETLRDRVEQHALVIAGIERDLRRAEVAAMQARAEALRAAEALQQAADVARKARGRLRRAWDGWWGERIRTRAGRLN
jgi:hypothetical protein